MNSPASNSPTGPTPDPTRILVLSMVAGGIITIAVGIYLGATVSAPLYAIAAVALIDFALAWAYGTGRLGPAAARRREAEASGEVAAEAQADPSYNPYARED